MTQENPVTISLGDIIAGLGKALAAAIEAYQAHVAELEAARERVATQAAGDLDAVDGKPLPS